MVKSSFHLFSALLFQFSITSVLDLKVCNINPIVTKDSFILNFILHVVFIFDVTFLISAYGCKMPVFGYYKLGYLFFCSLLTFVVFI